MVKRRHKPISDSEIVTLADQQAQKKVGAKQRLRIRDRRFGFTHKKAEPVDGPLAGLYSRVDSL
jgi:hypothetical protein